MISELDPVVVEPAAGDDGIAIEMGNIVTSIQLEISRMDLVEERLRSKESSQDVADESTNTVYSEDVKSVVTTKKILQLCSVVACDAATGTKDDGSPGRDVSGSRSYSH